MSRRSGPSQPARCDGHRRGHHRTQARGGIETSSPMPSSMERRGAPSLSVLSRANRITDSTSTTAADPSPRRIARRYSTGLSESSHRKVQRRTVSALVCPFAGRSSASTAARHGTRPCRTGPTSCSPYPGKMSLRPLHKTEMLHVTGRQCNATVACNTPSAPIHNRRWVSAYHNSSCILTKFKGQCFSTHRARNLPIRKVQHGLSGFHSDSLP